MTVHALTEAADHHSAIRPVPAGRSRDGGRRSHLRAAPDTAPTPPVLLTITLNVDATDDHDRLVRALREVVLASGARDSITMTPGAVTTSHHQPHHQPNRPPRPSAPVEIHADTRVVTVDGDPVPLTRLEFELLVFFVRHPRRVFTRTQLLGQVWGHSFASTRTIDVHIRRLRMKLGSTRPLVTTVRGVGYRLADEAPVCLTAA